MKFSGNLSSLPSVYTHSQDNIAAHGMHDVLYWFILLTQNLFLIVLM